MAAQLVRQGCVSSTRELKKKKTSKGVSFLVKLVYCRGRPVRATITLYPIERPVRATITLYPIGRPVRATITLYPIGRYLELVYSNTDSLEYRGG